MQSGDVPVTVAILALGLTVIDCCAETVPPHPPVIVNIMLQVPVSIPVTNPDVLTVAIAELLLLHTPVPPLRTTGFTEYVSVPVIHRGVVPDTKPILALGIIVTAKLLSELVPQLLPAVTLILPFCPVEPVVTVIEVVPVPDVIVHPVGTVHE